MSRRAVFFLEGEEGLRRGGHARSCRPFLSMLLMAFSAVVLPDLAAQPLTVTCGKLLDPATRTVKSNVMVAFDKGLVTAGPLAGAKTLDLSAFTCLPGLIDAHTHLLLQGDATSAEYDEQVLLESNAYRALR